VVAAIGGGLVLSSCASLNVDAIPLPGSSDRGGYDIVIEFTNVLNLPERAKHESGCHDEGDSHWPRG
jgi:phospholipid/cholesterol/gamma-HCH transport system substrate-binding protein